MSSIESDQTEKILRVVVLGASSRLARVIRPFWGGTDGIGETLWCARAAKGGDCTLDLQADPGAVAQVLQGADVVICLAGVVPRPGVLDFGANVTLAQAALDGALAAGVRHVFLASSAAVYGASSAPLSEVVKVAPLSPYGVAKHQMEQMASAHAQPNTCLRIGNVAGVDAILGGWRTAMALDQLEDGRTPRRSYIGPETLARLLQTLARHTDLPRLLNVAAPGIVEMGALLRAADLPFAHRPAGPNTLAEVHLDTHRIETLFKFAAQDSDAVEMVRQWRHIPQESGQ